MVSYEIEGNNFNNTNNTINNNTEINIKGIDYYNVLKDNNMNRINKQIEKNSQEELSHKSDDKREQTKNIDINEKEKEEDLPTSIRKFKKSVRRIDKMKNYMHFLEKINQKWQNALVVTLFFL
jgi:hypothetical protein